MEVIITACLLSVIALIVIPLIVYYSVKFGTVAHLRAKFLFDKRSKQENKERNDGCKKPKGQREATEETGVSS